MTTIKNEKTFLQILQGVTVLQLLLSFIPFFNPFGVDTAVRYSLASMLFHVGTVSEFFAQYSEALFLNSFFFVIVLLLTVLLAFSFLTIIISFAGADMQKSAARTLFYVNLVNIVLYIILFGVLLSVHGQILASGQGYITRKLFMFTKIPIGVYLFFFLSLFGMMVAFKAYGFHFHSLWYKLVSRASTYFKGGIHPSYHKSSAKKPIKILPPPQQMIYPLSQHIGATCQPLVKVGDDVRVGQKIADTDAAVSAPIHATVSGTVTKIEPYVHPNGSEVMSIFVQNDEQDRLHDDLLLPERDYLALQTDEIISIIREAGIVGMGGAAFPTHIKIASARGKVDTLIINAAECEPYLTSDHRVMLENTDELIGGIKVLRYALRVKSAYIGIESNKPDVIALLYKKLRRSGIRVTVLQTKYPQGGEKQLIKAITRREVPSGKLPADVGCCVFNVDTAIAVYRAVTKHQPLMRRIVTLGGKAMDKSANVNVRIGTPVSYVLEQYGVHKDKLKKLIMGGPMMGTAQYSLDVPVIKGTSALLCFSDEQVAESEAPATNCIRCGRCVSVCPMNLMPNYISKYAKLGRFDECVKFGAKDCIECGCCSYACPAKLPLIQYIRLSKAAIARQQPNQK